MLTLIAISISNIQKDISLYLIYVGSILNLVILIFTITDWIYHPKYKITHVTPGWFIPPVGIILIPIISKGLFIYYVSCFFHLKNDTTGNILGNSIL